MRQAEWGIQVPEVCRIWGMHNTVALFSSLTAGTATLMR